MRSIIALISSALLLTVASAVQFTAPVPRPPVPNPPPMITPERELSPSVLVQAIAPEQEPQIIPAKPTPQPHKTPRQPVVESLRLSRPPTAIDYALSDQLAERDHYAGNYGRDPGSFIPNHNYVQPWSEQVNMTQETEQHVEYRNSTGYYGEPLSERYDRELQGTARHKAVSPPLTAEQQFAQIEASLDPWQPSTVPETGRRHLICGVGSSHIGGHYVGGNVGHTDGHR